MASSSSTSPCEEEALVGTRHCPPEARECQQLWRQRGDWGMLNLGGWSCLSHCPYPPDPCDKERRWQVAFFGDVVCPGLFIACLTLIVVLWMLVEAGHPSAGQVSAWFGGIYQFVLSPGWGQRSQLYSLLLRQHFDPTMDFWTINELSSPLLFLLLKSLFLIPQVI